MDAYYNISATSALIYGLLTLIVNIRVYTVILKNRKKKAFSSSFFIVFIIANIVLLFYLTIGLHIPIPMSISLLFEVSRYVTDFTCLSPSWILLIICKALRMKVIPIYFNTEIRSGGGFTTKVFALNTITR
uniref:Uncharacterized protein n=1 Tax=Acrobeloides nanus TaxID=290746 RepID=A0A914CJC4_9BILA